MNLLQVIASRKRVSALALIAIALTLAGLNGSPVAAASDSQGCVFVPTGQSGTTTVVQSADGAPIEVTITDGVQVCASGAGGALSGSAAGGMGTTCFTANPSTSATGNETSAAGAGGTASAGIQATAQPNAGAAATTGENAAQGGEISVRTSGAGGAGCPPLSVQGCVVGIQGGDVSEGALPSNQSGTTTGPETASPAAGTSAAAGNTATGERRPAGRGRCRAGDHLRGTGRRPCRRCAIRDEHGAGCRRHAGNAGSVITRNRLSTGDTPAGSSGRRVCHPENGRRSRVETTAGPSVDRALLEDRRPRR